MADTIEVKVPDIGDFKDVPVIEVLVKAGDTVDKDQPLITLESDKATMEVPSPAAGTVKEVKLKEGDKVSQGSLILTLATQTQAQKKESATASPPAGSAAQPETAEKQTVPQPAAEEPSRKRPHRATGGETIEVKVPDIGDFKDVPVIEVLVKAGDTVDKDQPLITLESDKATMEVPSPAAGTVKEVKLKEGDRVAEGSLILRLQTAGADTAEAESPTAEAPARESEPAQPKPTKPNEEVSEPLPSRPLPPTEPAPRETLPYASPAVRKFARELGVDLTQVTGSGPRGRILQEDVQSFVKRAMAAPAAAGVGLPRQPEVDFSQWGEVETRSLPRIRKLSAANLHRNWLLVPHVTQTIDADVTDLETFRKTENRRLPHKLTMLPLLLKASAVAIRRFPEFASSLAPDGEHLIVKRYCHIGFAADTEAGLVVPVVRDVDKKSLSELAAECAELAERARAGKLKAAEMKGGVFSISSLGGIGGGYFTPIINAPEVAILGVSRTVTRPQWDGQQFLPRRMLPLSLSYDHRVIDGAAAARFCVYLAELLGDLRRLLL